MCGHFVCCPADFHCEIIFSKAAYLCIVKYTLISSRYQIIYNTDFFGFIYFLHIVTLPFVTVVTLSFYFSVIVIKQFQDGFGHLLLSVVFGEETPQILYLKTDMLGLIGFFL